MQTGAHPLEKERCRAKNPSEVVSRFRRFEMDVGRRDPEGDTSRKPWTKKDDSARCMLTALCMLYVERKKRDKKREKKKKKKEWSEEKKERNNANQR